MKYKRVLLKTADIDEGECKTIQLKDGAFTKEIFVVCKNADYFVYSNSCPHTGSPLDWMPNQFLNLDKTLIQCATHHALFRIEDGYCVAGPCGGQSLEKIPVVLVGNELVIEIDEEGDPQSNTDGP